MTEKISLKRYSSFESLFKKQIFIREKIFLIKLKDYKI